jgi:hypothetical protein
VASSSRRISRWEKLHSGGWPNLKYQLLEVSTREGHASVAESQAFSPAAVSRSGHLLAQPGRPNPSVTGTSRKRAAPYVER